MTKEEFFQTYRVVRIVTIEEGVLYHKGAFQDMIDKGDSRARTVYHKRNQYGYTLGVYETVNQMLIDAGVDL